MNFAYKMQMEGLMPDLPEENEAEPGSSSSGSAPLVGSKAKSVGGPPPDPSLPPPLPKTPPAGHGKSWQNHALPGPVPPALASTKGRLVCTPNEMKKFLYGSPAGSGTNAAQDVS